MTLDEMKAIAAKRTKGSWKYDIGNWEIEDENRSSICSLTDLDDVDGKAIAANLYDGEFIAMCANHFDKLIAVAEAAEATFIDLDALAPHYKLWDALNTLKGTL